MQLPIFPYLKSVNPKEGLTYSFKLNNSMLYSFKGDDVKEQGDFLKLPGIKSNFFKPMKNSILIGYNSLLTEDGINLTVYTHNEKMDDSKAFFNEPGDIFVSKEDFDKEIIVSISRVETPGKINITLYVDGGVRYSVVKEHSNLYFSNRWYVTNPFGGGTLPVTKNTFYNIKFK